MGGLDQEVRRYLERVLGVSVPELATWSRVAELPYYLRDAFDVRELRLFGQPVILALDKDSRGRSLGEVPARLSKLENLSGALVTFVTPALASWERKRLIEKGVAFIVPGNQMFVPQLGVDLREHFLRRARPADSRLSPSTQAVLILALLREPWQPEWRPSELAAGMGYTPMTLSRVVSELVAAGLATSFDVGRLRWVRMEKPPRRIWEEARKLMRTPVKRVFWGPPRLPGAGGLSPLAGLSALARLSMLAEPDIPVRAISVARWKAAKAEGLREMPVPEAGCCEWQVWSYGPALTPDASVVDPLSLELSLQGSPDERVQLALDELQGRLPW